MSSGYSPRWKRFLYKVTPSLFKQCPEGNYHWKWEKYCFGCIDHDSMHIVLYCFRTKRRWTTSAERYEKNNAKSN